DGGRGTGELRDRFSGPRGDVARALWNTGALLKSGRGSSRSFVGRLIHGVVAVTLDPFEFDFTSAQRDVEELEQVLVEDVLAIGLLPSSPLPAGHPLRQGVDDVLGVAEDLEVLTAVRCRPEEVGHGHEFAAVVRRVLPAAGVPAAVVDVPGAPGRARVSERGAVRGSDDRQWFSLESRIPFFHD